MKRARIAASCAVAALAVSAALWVAPRLPGEAAEVRLTEVRLGSVEQTLHASGRIRREQEYAAFSPAAGIVREIYVRPGEQVTAGQALFRLDGTAGEQALSEAIGGRERPAAWAVQTAAALKLDTEVVAEAAQEQADRQLEEASAALSALTVRAQADGTVEQVLTGELSGTAAGTPVLAISGGDQQISAQVVARDAEKVKPGMAARITAGERQVKAWVRSVGPVSADMTTGQAVSEILLTPETELELPLGTPVDVVIVLASCEDVPVLPVSALTGADTVWWSCEGRCYEIPAEVLLSDEQHCWVALPEGMQVIEQGDGLTEGRLIREVQP